MFSVEHVPSTGSSCDGGGGGWPEEEGREGQQASSVVAKQAVGTG